jgi:hypothetical protein
MFVDLLKDAKRKRLELKYGNDFGRGLWNRRSLEVLLALLVALDLWNDLAFSFAFLVQV